MSNETLAPATEEVIVKKKKTTVKDVLSVVVNVILVIAMIVAAICTYVSFVSTSGNGVPNLFGYEFFSVQTDSMYPTLKSGDLVIDKFVEDPSELRVEDIITYWTVINGERVLNTHRINQIYDGGNYLIFETKGDKNTVADSMTVHESEVVGEYVTHISGVGKVLDYLQTSTGFLIVVVLPVAIFFLFHLIQFFRVLFEYQNVKNRLKYYDELGAQGIVLDPKGVATPKKNVEEEEAAPVVDKAQIEAEIREKIKEEMLAEMLAELKKQNEVNAALLAKAAVAAEPEVEPAVESAASEAKEEEVTVEEPVEKTPSVTEDAPEVAEDAENAEETEAEIPDEETVEAEVTEAESADESMDDVDIDTLIEEFLSDDETEDASADEPVESAENEENSDN